jgi:hypothetical protein
MESKSSIVQCPVRTDWAFFWHILSTKSKNLRDLVMSSEADYAFLLTVRQTQLVRYQDDYFFFRADN